MFPFTELVYWELSLYPAAQRLIGNVSRGSTKFPLLDLTTSMLEINVQLIPILRKRQPQTYMYILGYSCFQLEGSVTTYHVN